MTILVLDFGETKIKSALISETFELEKPLAFLPSADNLENLQKLMDSIIVPAKDRISELTISCPKTVDTQAGTIYKGDLLTYLDDFEA
ncbi:hypothetical protein ACVR0S_02010 [Streptococcus dentapri]|uniref:Uncharacterized protein n=1 Tax=Streptococcus dentapri TaxID=573564 RepID=A0ABV8CYR9_9STRE